MPNPRQMLLRKFMFEGSNSEEARLLSRSLLTLSLAVALAGVSLLDERWDANHRVLSGRSAVVIDDPHVKTVHLPDGYCLEGAEAKGAKVQIASRKETATVRIVPTATKTVAWKMTFSRWSAHLRWTPQA